MPFWLQKLLFGSVTVEYLVSRASGRTFVGTVEFATHRSDYFHLHGLITQHTSERGDPTVFVQFDVRAQQPGALDEHSRLARALRPC
jgi:hypothetical protein